ncbi:MAG: hypothetical protein KF752_08095 [Pirellulaceae bacterium]|nr:hypothetical protein [Pirellulaceae bacterium]
MQIRNNHDDTVGEEMKLIKAAVGRGGINHPEDVVVIQQLLEGCTWHLFPLKPINVTGRIDAVTQAAIETFQPKVEG